MFANLQKMTLSQEKIDFYRDNGFVQIDGVLSPGETEELRAYMEEAMAAPDGISINTGQQNSSYYKVLNQKVNTWRDHAGMAKFVMHPRFAHLALQLTGADGIRLFHDHGLWKMPGDSKPTPWHQDFVYWPMNEPGPLSIWIALDDVDENNGCMMFVPKSHQVGKLTNIDLVHPQDLFEYAQGSGLDRKSAVISRMKAGSVTFHHGLTFHYAHANKTDKPRRVLAIIYMPDGTTYNGKNHLCTDGPNNAGLEPGKPLATGLFPLLAKKSS